MKTPTKRQDASSGPCYSVSACAATSHLCRRQRGNPVSVRRAVRFAERNVWLRNQRFCTGLSHEAAGYPLDEQAAVPTRRGGLLPAGNATLLGLCCGLMTASHGALVARNDRRSGCSTLVRACSGSRFRRFTSRCLCQGTCQRADRQHNGQYDVAFHVHSEGSGLAHCQTQNVSLKQNEALLWHIRGARMCESSNTIPPMCLGAPKARDVDRDYYDRCQNQKSRYCGDRRKKHPKSLHKNSNLMLFCGLFVSALQLFRGIVEGRPLAYFSELSDNPSEIV